MLKCKKAGGLRQYLVSYVEVEKEVLKTAIYSILFGASVTTRTSGSPKTLFKKRGYAEHYPTFLEIKVIKDLIKARTDQREQIRRDLGGTNAFGRRVELYAIDQQGRVSESSVMANVAQSYEMQVMAEIACQVMSMKTAHLTLWMHDGIAVSNKKGDLRTIVSFAKDLAQSLDLATELIEDKLEMAE